MVWADANAQAILEATVVPGLRKEWDDAAAEEIGHLQDALNGLRELLEKTAQAPDRDMYYESDRKRRAPRAPGRSLLAAPLLEPSVLG